MKKLITMTALVLSLIALGENPLDALTREERNELRHMAEPLIGGNFDEVWSKLPSHLQEKIVRHYQAKSVSADLFAEVKGYLNPGHRSGSGFASFDAGEFEDVSTMEDGINPSLCTDERKNCVFRDKYSHLMWTSVTSREGTSGTGELKTQEEAVLACAALKNWGGYSDWRLPTMYEMRDVERRKPSTLPTFSMSNAFVWTSTFLLPGEVPFDQQEPDMPYALHPLTGKTRQFDKSAVFTWRCVRSPYEKFWADMSTDGDGKTRVACTLPEQDCVFQDKRTGLLWTERSPNVKDFDPESQDTATHVTAKAACASLNFAGQTGWRLPDMRDLSRATANGLGTLSLGHEHMSWILTQLWTSYDGSNPDANYFGGNIPTGPWSFTLSYPVPHIEKVFTHKNASHHQNPRYQNPYSKYEPPRSVYVCVKSPGDPAVVVTVGALPDTDGDGVPNNEDHCPNTPKGKTSWKKGDTYHGNPIASNFWGCSAGETPAW